MKIVVFIFLISIVLSIYEAKIKGYIGEKAIARILTELSESEYKVIHDIMLKTDYGTTQIDHVILSIYGIFVIETKNYQGWITGGENSDKWTKNMYGKKYRFRNPLKQNYAHVKALEEALGVSIDVFIPVVVFTNRATIKVQTKSPVIYMSQLREFISKYNEKRLSFEEICVMEQKIITMNIVDRKTRKEHVREIHTKVSNNNMKISMGMCPKCGGKLIKRKGKYGEFYGCGNYPKCRYIYK